MSAVRSFLEEAEARRTRDAQRWHKQDGDLCMLCHAYGADKRSLFIACFYAVHEVVPEAINLSGLEDESLKQRGYYLRICKSCRGRLLGHLEQWRAECVALQDVPKDHDGDVLDEPDPERNTPYRLYGTTVMLTYEEWEAKEQQAAERAGGEGEGS